MSPVKRGFVDPLPQRDRFNRDVEHSIHDLEGVVVQVKTPPVADQAFPVRHRLGRKASSYEVVRRNKAGDLFEAKRNLWTESVAWFQYGSTSATLSIRLR